MSDLNVVHAAQLARVTDAGEPRRGRAQDELDLVADGAVAVRGGLIVGAGPTDEVLAEFGDAVTTFDASGMTVLPGFVESHSHPLFSGDRSLEYADRLAGASLEEVARRGGGIWSSVEATRSASDAELDASLQRAYRKVVAGGATTLEVKSGYGLTPETELHQLDLLRSSRSSTPLQLVVTFLGAHIVPRGTQADAYTAAVAGMLDDVAATGTADFHDITCERGLFTPAHASSLFDRSRALGIATKCHADAWASSSGWETAVAGGAISADHLTYTSESAIREIGAAETVAVLLPQAELVYMTDRRAPARLLVEEGVAVALATDYCSSIHATSLAATAALAAPWFHMTPAEVFVAVTLNAAYALASASDRGSLDTGKRGDLTILGVPHPAEACLAVGQDVVAAVVIGGEVVLSHHPQRTTTRGDEP